RLTSRPVCRRLGDVRTAWGFIGLDELDTKVVEKGFAVAGQAKGHGEAAVRWRLAVDDDPGEARDRVGSAILELLATQRVADDDAAHARRAGDRPLDLDRDADQVLGVNLDGRRADRRDGKVEERQIVVEVFLVLGLDVHADHAVPPLTLPGHRGHLGGDPVELVIHVDPASLGHGLGVVEAAAGDAVGTELVARFAFDPVNPEVKLRQRVERDTGSAANWLDEHRYRSWRTVGGLRKRTARGTGKRAERFDPVTVHEGSQRPAGAPGFGPGQREVLAFLGFPGRLD